MSGPIHVRERFISRQYGQDLIDRYGHDLEPSTTIGPEAQHMRVSDQRMFEDKDLGQLIVDEVYLYALRQGIAISGGYEPMTIIRYKAGGKYDLHMDSSMDLGHPTSERKVAVVLALNDNFEGGGTQWIWPGPNDPKTALPKAGTIALFPSILLHAGLPVISGERWIVVTWALGPPWS